MPWMQRWLNDLFSRDLSFFVFSSIDVLENGRLDNFVFGF